ncbi:MAG TPA: hypothetical protein VK430_02595 [Xanthobacteraceae bacterium]|nr:hypothetical protein [Xanthobacteraceae bacterium]
MRAFSAVTALAALGSSDPASAPTMAFSDARLAMFGTDDPATAALALSDELAFGLLLGFGRAVEHA